MRYKDIEKTKKFVCKLSRLTYGLFNVQKYHLTLHLFNSQTLGDGGNTSDSSLCAALVFRFFFESFKGEKPENAVTVHRN